eukprot:g46339.t1
MSQGPGEALAPGIGEIDEKWGKTLKAEAHEMYSCAKQYMTGIDAAEAWEKPNCALFKLLKQAREEWDTLSNLQKDELLRELRMYAFGVATLYNALMGWITWSRIELRRTEEGGQPGKEAEGEEEKEKGKTILQQDEIEGGSGGK